MKFSNDTANKEKSIIKVNDSYLGLGDQVVKDFCLGTKEGKAKINKIFTEEYQNQKALLLDFVKPKKELGVHSIDILTIR